MDKKQFKKVTKLAFLFNLKNKFFNRQKKSCTNFFWLLQPTNNLKINQKVKPKAILSNKLLRPICF